MFFKFLKQKVKNAKQLGGLEEKEQAINKTNAAANRINEIVNSIDLRFHDVPVIEDRRKPA